MYHICDITVWQKFQLDNVRPCLRSCWQKHRAPFHYGPLGSTGIFVRAGRPETWNQLCLVQHVVIKKSDPPKLLQPTTAPRDYLWLLLSSPLDNLVRKIELLYTQVYNLCQPNSRNQGNHIQQGGFCQGGSWPKSQHQIQNTSATFWTDVLQVPWQISCRAAGMQRVVTLRTWSARSVNSLDTA